MKELVYKYLKEVEEYTKTMARFGFNSLNVLNLPGLHNHPGPLDNQGSYEVFYLRRRAGKLEAIAFVSDKKIKYNIEDIYVIDIMAQDKGIHVVSGLIDQYNDPSVLGNSIHFDVVSDRDTLEELFDIEIV
jgi:hypothetical protein